MPQEFEEDVHAKIIQRAMEMDNAGQHHEDVLLRTATELGIPHETVMAARDQVLSEQEEQRDRKLFRAERLKELYTHIATYLAVNAFLFTIDLMKDGRLNWAYWSLLGWGLGVVLHAVSDAPWSEDFERDFQKWRKKRRKRQ